MGTVYNHLAITGQFHYNFRVAKTVKKKWSLYILKCGDRTLYTGITVNLPRRLEKHRNGTASKYTRSRLPVRMVHHETCSGRSDALKKELAIKKLSRADKEVYIRKPWTIKR
jgi:putative endonuclease